MTEYQKIMAEFGQYEKSYELDRLWSTFVIPEELLARFVDKCQGFIKEREKTGGDLTIKWSPYFNKFVCTLVGGYTYGDS